jgi:hypothetical protein
MIRPAALVNSARSPALVCAASVASST